jgi:hypothetical protein
MPLQRGTFVDYRISDTEIRPALVVRVWTETCAQFQVFPDKANDGADPWGADWFRSSAVRGDGVGQWVEAPVSVPFQFTNSTFIPLRQQPAIFPACTCGQAWWGTVQPPPCPVHGFRQNAPIEFKVPNGNTATATAVPMSIGVAPVGAGG